MAVVIKHKKSVNKPDGTDESIVRPSDWNEEHAVQMTGPALVGKSDLGNGQATEVSLSNDFILDGDQLKLNPENPVLKLSEADERYAALDQAILYDSASGKAKLPNGELVTLGGSPAPSILSVGDGSVSFED